MIYENCKIYGPYTRKDGRQHICIVLSDKRKITVSYPKYLMEKHLNRQLRKDETVDHIDRNFNNNEISNLQILSRQEHCSLDAIRDKEQKFNCEYCGIEFILLGKKLNDAKQNRMKGSKGPFCGKICAGKASHDIEKYDIKNVSVIHYKKGK